MAEYIERKTALDILQAMVEETMQDKHPYGFVDRLLVCDTLKRAGGRIIDIPAADVQPVKWIPVTSRPMDEEERAEWSAKIGYDIEYEDATIYTSQLPDDGEEVLTCNRYGNVRIDTFNSDPEYGCYFEDNGDMDGIVAWMPLPEPPKGENNG